MALYVVLALDAGLKSWLESESAGYVSLNPTGTWLVLKDLAVLMMQISCPVGTSPATVLCCLSFPFNFLRDDAVSISIGSAGESDHRSFSCFPEQSEQQKHF